VGGGVGGGTVVWIQAQDVEGMEKNLISPGRVSDIVS
jgi:hypothetical protein